MVGLQRFNAAGNRQLLTCLLHLDMHHPIKLHIGPVMHYLHLSPNLSLPEVWVQVDWQVENQGTAKVRQAGGAVVQPGFP